MPGAGLKNWRFRGVIARLSLDEITSLTPSVSSARVKRGELNNTSIVLNGYENKAKYGTAYGYGYGAYSYGYHEEEEKKPGFVKSIFNKFNKK